MASDRSDRRERSSTGPASSVPRTQVESESVEAVAPAILASLCGGLGCEASELWRISRRTGRAGLVSFWVDPGLDIHGRLMGSLGIRLPSGVGLPGRVVSSGAPVSAAEGPHEGSECPLGRAGDGLESAFAFPVRFGGDTIAVLCFHGSTPIHPSGAELELLRNVSLQVGQLEGRNRALADVRRSEAGRAAITEAALDCIITVDHEGKIIEFNPAAVRTFGWQPAEVIGRSVAEVLVPEERRDRFARLVARVATMEGSDGVRGERIEGWAMRKSGERFPVELTITRVDAVGPPIFIAYLRDITEAKMAEQEREQLLGREREARIAAEEATQRMSFLAAASRVLASSLDLDETLRQIASLVVPSLADWCAIDIIGPEGEIEPAVIEHPDPTEVAWAYRLRESYPLSMSDAVGVAEVIRTGTSVLAESIDEADLSAVAHDDSHLEELLRFSSASVMVVPLATGRRIVGAMTLLSVSPGRRYERRDVELAEELASHAGVAIDNARLYADKSHIASSLQRSLLPVSLPAIEGMDVAVRYVPSGAGYEVGGDFYDLVELEGGRWALAVGDVQGKGPEAAALIGLARHTLRTAVQYETDPARVLAVVNDAMLNGGSGRLCTVALALMIPDQEGYLLRVVCGGHPQPIVIRSEGHVEPVGTLGTVLGVFTDPTLRYSDSRMAQGDVLVVFSDGILGPEQEAAELFRHMAPTNSARAETIADQILASVPFMGEAGPRDDVSLLVARLT